MKVTIFLMFLCTDFSQTFLILNLQDPENTHDSSLQGQTKLAGQDCKDIISNISDR